jgi:hypothetical protein
MSYEYGRDSQQLQRHGYFKCSLTWKLFIYSFIYWKKDCRVTFYKCSKWPLSATMHVLTHTTESLTLPRTATSLTRLAALKFRWSSSTRRPACIHIPRFSCNPTQGNVVNWNPVNVVANTADRPPPPPRPIHRSENCTFRQCVTILVKCMEGGDYPVVLVVNL